MTTNASERDFAELALAVYLEELASGRRVLYVGDPDSPAAERLSKAASHLEVVTPGGSARGTRRGGRVRTRPWPSREDEGRWDLVVVPDLPGAGLARDVETIAGWLAEDGVLVAGTPDPEGPAGHEDALGYEELFDLLEDSFDAVRMIGQAPFHGFSVVDFDPPGGELEVTFDGSLLEGAGERAQRYVALCGDRDVVVDAYAVIQTPASETAPPAVSSEPAEESSPELQEALDAANLHAEELERELEEAQKSIEAARADVERARKREAETRGRVDELRAEAESLSKQLARPAAEDSGDDEYVRLETALHERGQELTQARAEIERRGVLVRDLVEEMRTLRKHGSVYPGAGGSEPPPGGLGGFGVRTTMEIHPDAMHAALHGQVADAVERAVAAEAERTALQFRLDEVRGELAVAENRAAQETDERGRIEAALRGTVRGLNARLAEVTEMYQLTQARLALCEEDRSSAERRALERERQMAELREQLELEMARYRVRESADDRADGAGTVTAEDLLRLERVEREGAAREGQLMGALLACQERHAELALRQRQAGLEAQLAREALLEIEERVEGMRRGYEARVAELVLELSALGGSAERAVVHTGELGARLERAEREGAALRGEAAGLRLRLADREAAVESLRAQVPEPGDRRRGDRRTTDRQESDRPESEPTPPKSGSRVIVIGRGATTEPDEPEETGAQAAEAEHATLAARLDEAQAEIDTLRERADALARQLAEALEAASARDEEGPDPRVALSARDGIISRLQSQLSHGAEHRRRLQREVDALRAQLSEHRETVQSTEAVADVRVEESTRELEELTERLERSEAERRDAMTALEEAREILTRVMRSLPEEDDDVAVGGQAEARRLRDRMAQLDAEAADREVLLRSLTAQLQERDDRIRALERMANGNGAPAGQDRNELEARLLEMEERVARLTEELEHERRRSL